MTTPTAFRMEEESGQSAGAGPRIAPSRHNLARRNGSLGASRFDAPPAAAKRNIVNFAAKQNRFAAKRNDFVAKRRETHYAARGRQHECNPSQDGRLGPSLALLFGAQTGLARADISDLFDPVTSMFGTSNKYKTEITPDIPADDLYNEGLAKLKAKDYENATKKFQEVEKRFPFSQWARKGLLMTVYAQYEKPAYDDAIASAKRYIELYPKSPDTPYMYYLTGHVLL